MRIIILFVFVTGWTVAFALPVTTQGTQEKSVRKPATATVSGRVTNNGKGRGGIVVGLRSGRADAELGRTYKAVTDPDGIYRITNIPAGNYRIAPIAPSYVVSDLPQFSWMGKPLIVGEGETVEGIDFAVLRGAVVTGRVTDADGRPIIDEQVHVVPADQEEQQRGPFYSNYTTDDRGIYRVFGLSPGRYKVFVGSGTDNFFGTIGRPRTRFARVYYADSIKPEEPKILDLAEGTEATNIDIILAPAAVDGFSMKATAVDAETNRPVANTRFGIQRIIDERRAPSYGSSTMTNARGELRYDNLAPGKYAIVMMPTPGGDLRADPVPFEIVNQDVAGLMVRVVKGAVVSGVVVIEGAHDKSVAARLAQSRLMAFVRGAGGPGGFAQSTPLGADGTFRIGGLDGGLVDFQLTSPSRRMEDVLYISRVEHEGVVHPQGLEIKSGEVLSGVKLVILTGTGSVSGTMKIDNGPALQGMRFVVRLEKAGERGMARTNEVDARGHFVIPNVPAGTYDLVLTGFIPESRTRAPSVRQSVTVTEGAVTDVELVMDLNSTRTP